jgi:hypothetical protein
MDEELARKRISEFDLRSFDQVKAAGVFPASIPGSGTFRVKVSDLVSADQMEAHVQSNIHVTNLERATWNGKYEKPSSGIPLSDLAQAVRDAIAAGGSGGGSIYDDTALKQRIYNAEIGLQDLQSWKNGLVIPPAVDLTPLANRVTTIETWKTGLVIPPDTSSRVSALESWKNNLVIPEMPNLAPFATVAMLEQVKEEFDDSIINIHGDMGALQLAMTNLGNSKQGLLTAGVGISINNNVISATGEGQGGYNDAELRESIAENTTAIGALWDAINAIHIPNIQGLENLINGALQDIQGLSSALNSKQPRLTSTDFGEGLQINNGVISAIPYDDGWIHNSVAVIDENMEVLNGHILTLGDRVTSLETTTTTTRTATITSNSSTYNLQNGITYARLTTFSGGRLTFSRSALANANTMALFIVQNDTAAATNIYNSGMSYTGSSQSDGNGVDVAAGEVWMFIAPQGGTNFKCTGIKISSTVAKDIAALQTLLNSLTYDGTAGTLQEIINLLKAADDSIYAIADTARSGVSALATRVTALENAPSGGGGGGAAQKVVVISSSNAENLGAISGANLRIPWAAVADADLIVMGRDNYNVTTVIFTNTPQAGHYKRFVVAASDYNPLTAVFSKDTSDQGARITDLGLNATLTVDIVKLGTLMSLTKSTGAALSADKIYVN